MISPTTREVMGCELIDNIEVEKLLSNLSGLLGGYRWEGVSECVSECVVDDKEKEDFSIQEKINKENIINETEVNTTLTHTTECVSECVSEEKSKQPLQLPLSLKNMSGIFRALDISPVFTSEMLPQWTPPCITVIGNESSGKSTILERLLMMSIFPRGEDICTRYTYSS